MQNKINKFVVYTHLKAWYVDPMLTDSLSSEDLSITCNMDDGIEKERERPKVSMLQNLGDKLTITIRSLWFSIVFVWVFSDYYFF